MSPARRLAGRGQLTAAVAARIVQGQRPGVLDRTRPVVPGLHRSPAASRPVLLLQLVATILGPRVLKPDLQQERYNIMLKQEDALLDIYESMNGGGLGDTNSPKCTLFVINRLLCILFVAGNTQYVTRSYATDLSITDQLCFPVSQFDTYTISGGARISSIQQVISPMLRFEMV